MIIHSRSAKTWGRMPRALDIKMWSHRYNPTGSRFKGAPGDKPFVVRGKVLKKNTRISHRKYRHACRHTIYEFDQYSGSFPSPSVVFLPEGKARWIAAEKLWFLPQVEHGNPHILGAFGTVPRQWHGCLTAI